MRSGHGWIRIGRGWRRGGCGGHICQSGSGGRCGRIIAADGSAWDYFTHDQARSRVYRWGEDGIAGISDIEQRLCFSVALWNGKDPILKERLFGLTGSEGNHGEDVKELYYYVDATPTHSYLKMLYKYPQAEYPYAKLVEENRRRGKGEREYEILDTGVFEGSRYFDVVVEYAKAGVEDILIEITAHNRGPDGAPLHLLPQAWFRNTWSWKTGEARPRIRVGAKGELVLEHETLGQYFLYAENAGELLFCENESNGPRLFGMAAEGGATDKDGFHERLVYEKAEAVNAEQVGTKAAVWYSLVIPAGTCQRVRLRLSKGAIDRPFLEFDPIFAVRRGEADAFYAEHQQGMEDADARLVQRQAWAGMIWSKQFYYLDIPEWIKGDPACPAPPRSGRTAGTRIGRI